MDRLCGIDCVKDPELAPELAHGAGVDFPYYPNDSPVDQPLVNRRRGLLSSVGWHEPRLRAAKGQITDGPISILQYGGTASLYELFRIVYSDLMATIQMFALYLGFPTQCGRQGQTDPHTRGADYDRLTDDPGSWHLELDTVGSGLWEPSGTA